TAPRGAALVVTVPRASPQVRENLDDVLRVKREVVHPVRPTERPETAADDFCHELLDFLHRLAVFRCECESDATVLVARSEPSVAHEPAESETQLLGPGARELDEVSSGRRLSGNLLDGGR